MTSQRIFAVLLLCLIAMPAADLSAQTDPQRRISELEKTIGRLQAELRDRNSTSPPVATTPFATRSPDLNVMPQAMQDSLDIAPPARPGSRQSQEILPAPPAETFAAPPQTGQLSNGSPVPLLTAPNSNCPGGVCRLPDIRSSCPGGVCPYDRLQQPPLPIAGYSTGWRPPYVAPPITYPRYPVYFTEYYLRTPYRYPGCWLD